MNSSDRMHERMGAHAAAGERNGDDRFRPGEPPELVMVWVDTPTGGYHVAVHVSELAKPVVPTSVTFANGGGR